MVIEDEVESVKLLFVGDVVMTADKTVNLSDEVKKIFNKYDLRCCNFEGPVVKDNTPFSKKIGPLIKQERHSASNIVDLGFNCVCLANNHIFDYGCEGLKHTVDALSNVDTVGASISKENVYKPVIKTINGITVGIINVAENGFGCEASSKSNIGYAWMFHNDIEKYIVDTKKKCDFLIMVCHAGLEKVNYPLPEFREQYKRFIDYGADAIIAHHPHVVQGWEYYNNKLIAYSLGNFIWQKSKLYSPNTIMIGLDVNSKEESSVSIYYVTQNGDTIELCEDKGFIAEVKKYCSVLKNDEKYLEIINKECDRIFEENYRRYYALAAGVYASGSLKSRIKAAVKMLFRGNKMDDLLLYHNLSIETHVWTCKRALKNILKME